MKVFQYFLLILFLGLLISLVSASSTCPPPSCIIHPGIIIGDINHPAYNPVDNYTSLSALLLSDGSYKLTADTKLGTPYLIDYDAGLAANDILRRVEFLTDPSLTGAGQWDYTITFYDGITTISGFINVSSPGLMNNFVFAAEDQTLHTNTIGFVGTGHGVFRIEYAADNQLLNGGAAKGMLSSENVYASIQYCDSITGSCGGDLVLIPLSKAIAENPMTHIRITNNATYPAEQGTLITVNVDLLRPQDLIKNEPVMGKFACSFTDPFTWPGCILNWVSDNIPYAKTMFVIIAALWGVAGFIFGNFMIFVFLVPGISFAYRVSTEPDIFLAISKTSSDLIFLVEMILNFFYRIIKIFIPI